MEKAKEILRLSLHMGLKQREVASGTGYSLKMLNTALTPIMKTGIVVPHQP
jgi:DNA-binding transcriptional regulator LsrR (DeoR family)